MHSAKSATDPFAALADELGALEKEMAPFAPQIARIAALRKALRAGCPVAAHQEWSVQGKRFQAVLGACAMERKVNYAALIKRIGAGVFAKFATCTLKDLEAKVAPAIVAQVVTSAATGSRPLETFERP